MLSVCGKMSRGFLNMADESRYLTEEEHGYKSQNSLSGLDVQYIRRSAWQMSICVTKRDILSACECM